MITKFNRYINEGVRELMTGKSIEEAKALINNLPLKDKFSYINKYKLSEFYTKEELDNFLMVANPSIKFIAGIENNEFWPIKMGIKEDPTIVKRFSGILPTAVRKCDAEIIKYLVDKGFDTTASDSWALQLVTIDSDYDKVKILLDGGAISTTKIIEIALNNHKYNQDIVDLLFKHANKIAIKHIQNWGHNYRGRFRPKDAYPILDE